MKIKQMHGNVGMKLGFGVGLAVLFMAILATVVMAAGSPPAPYAGMKNPFQWSDTGAQTAGQDLYKQSCLG